MSNNEVSIHKAGRVHIPAESIHTAGRESKVNELKFIYYANILWIVHVVNVFRFRIVPNRACHYCRSHLIAHPQTLTGALIYFLSANYILGVNLAHSVHRLFR